MDILSIICFALLIVIFTSILVLLISRNKRSSGPLSSDDMLRLKEIFDQSIDRSTSRLDGDIKNLRDSISNALSTINSSNMEQMDYFYKKLASFENTVNNRQLDMLNMVNARLKEISDGNAIAFRDISEKTEKLTLQIRSDMDKIRVENNQKLDEMKRTVDEKLQSTLEERISKAFKEVTDNLSKLYASLGSLNALTEDVKSINRIFSNVKARGIWGEMQAESILSDILASDQYEKDYSPKGTREKVEFAIRLPGKEGKGDVYLPIDSKFPTADYVKYKEAVDSKNDAEIEASLKMLKERVLSEAKDIQKKYINPPETTDFAILFLPAESIYAELLRMDGFVERLQSEFRVLLTGPNNFAALLNSLSLGFRTLQIEQYTSRIWKSFEVLKKYFADLSKSIDESKKAVDKASDTLESAARKKEKLSSVLVNMESTAEKALLANTEYIEYE